MTVRDDPSGQKWKIKGGKLVTIFGYFGEN